ncbi:unnamed protein product [Oikopleura dioica]|uniref:FZ domain-containing protein n=1 Tax=Oikopleura dioica TaxID=34765 RepID=E4YHJ3_OIKDI|nr:unnamed protein product [Oikopleura dioica]
MKLFSVFVIAAVSAQGFDNKQANLARNLDLTESDEDREKRFKQECKDSIGNKQDTPRWNEKMEACRAKKDAKHAKRVAKAEAAEDRAQMKAEIKTKKAEKAPIKAERNLCKAACKQIANQITKSNCLSWWKYSSRVEIQKILDDINDIRNPAERNSVEHCYTKSGLSGSESTCKDFAVDFCDGLNLAKPSPILRDCKSFCVNQCMEEGENCDWTPADYVPDL